ncbi:ATP-dependent Clp protease proteolytic subunit [Dysgonomonas termitidis]|uniref:ATP-dependent Clp protease proteolytic subunit n=1 Tax=Dysgonomonas termitidis TaxID=1516126 RepID=A0ABV9KVA7_9BACT
MDKKIPFNINASAQGQTALIRITGTIGWDTDCEQFRTMIDGIAKNGIADAHLYLNGPGGSCFDAEEIVNIIQSVFTGRVTGEGGALVASAYTRIAAICETFEQPENGMFMIHKPSGGAYGTAKQIGSYLKLVTDIEANYFNIFKAKATDAATFEKQWEAGDWWMTAKEAKANGFISSVKENTKIDADTNAMIMACGCPASIIPIINDNKNEETMDLKAMAKALGLSENATEAEIQAAIASAQNAAADLATLKAENARKQKEADEKRNKAEVEAAVKDKRITADNEKMWVEALTENYDKNSKLLASLSPVAKIPTNTGGGKTATGTVKHQGKTFEELQEEDPDALAALMEDDIDTYDELYSNYLVRNNLK